jgi:hypothetical protein
MQVAAGHASTSDLRREEAIDQVLKEGTPEANNLSWVDGKRSEVSDLLK